MSTNALVPLSADEQKLKAFSQIAGTAASGLLPSGITTVAQAMAVCWMADALAVHPMVMMQACSGVVHGRPIWRWQFFHALLKSRLPGYSFKVIHEGDDYCEVWGSDGRDEHTVRYTFADAQRQGLVTRNPSYGTQRKEMLFKQAYKRLADRVGAHILMGMGALMVESEVEEEDGAPVAAAVSSPPASGSSAEVVVEPLPGSQPIRAEAPAPEKPEAESPAWRDELLAKLRDRGYKTKKEKLNICSTLATHAGGKPVRFTRADQIDVLSARLIIQALESGAALPAPSALPAPAAREPGDDVEESEPTDLPPPEEEVPAPEAAAPDLSVVRAREVDGTFEGLMSLVKRARAALGRQIVKEAPAGSGIWWFVDAQIFARCGHSASLKIAKGGVGDGQLGTLTRAQVRALALETQKETDAAEAAR